ncbi:hypothetical protein ACFFQW_42150 [Umezawaea endophytica]|uniref:hypothetical protein n=1 Tax=Umezawaea endophytica TaxID=1654476 RepID=UPI0035E63D65
MASTSSTRSAATNSTPSRSPKTTSALVVVCGPNPASAAGVLHDGKEVSLRFSDFFEFTDDGRFSRRDTFFFAPLV